MKRLAFLLLALALATLPLAARAVSLATMHHFTNEGHEPNTALVRDADGNFYSTAQSGGPGGGGTIFRITPAGVTTLLHAFVASGNDGDGPLDLTLGQDGNVYGTTRNGGTDGNGTVFQMTPTGTFVVLYRFTNGTDGRYPNGGLIRDQNGNLFGTASAGGGPNQGTVFQVSAAGAFTLLHAFTATNGDGSAPDAGLVLGKDGNFYGTTEFGGDNKFGTIFRTRPNGVHTTIYSFAGNANGSYPTSQLIVGNDGTFYGTAVGGGVGKGIAYRFTSTAVFSVLHAFTGTGTEGANPSGRLYASADGFLYGTTPGGGSSGDNGGNGTVYKVTPAGAGFATVHVFAADGTEGIDPEAGLVQGQDGRFYGTTLGFIDTFFGTTPAISGTVYALSSEGAFAVLHSFNPKDGAKPKGGLIQQGNLFYGTTYMGGVEDGGTVFSVTQSGVYSALDDFSNDSSSDVYGPNSSLVAGTDGNLYGVLQYGGKGYGAVFSASPSGGRTIIFQFSAVQGQPGSALVLGTDGFLYGTTTDGGRGNAGTIFRLTLSGEYTLMHSFGGGTNGSSPQGGLMQDSTGNFYGTTFSGGAKGLGTAFRMSPSGTFTLLHSFAGGSADGANPKATLVADDQGYLYGTTTRGGSEDTQYGTVYRMTKAGAVLVLHHFTFTGTDGGDPEAALIRAKDGNFYGTTRVGGSNNSGTIFQATPAGGFATLYSFGPLDDYGYNADGGFPLATLFVGSSGNFFGTTSTGGKGTAGTAFRFNVVPAITSLATATATKGKAFSYKIKATNAPKGFAATNLPNGLSLNPKTGVISGTPTVVGKFNVVLQATNVLGTGNRLLVLTVAP